MNGDHVPPHFLTVANTKNYLTPGIDLDNFAQQLIDAAQAGKVVEPETGEASLRIVATSGTPMVITTGIESEAQRIHPREHAIMLDADQF